MKTPQLIPVSKPVRTTEDDVADAIVEAINAEGIRQRDEHKRIWDMLWRHVDADPTKTLQALGDRLPRVFAFSAENIRHLTAVAETAGLTLEQFGLGDHSVVPEAFRS